MTKDAWKPKRLDELGFVGEGSLGIGRVTRRACTVAAISRHRLVLWQDR